MSRDYSSDDVRQRATGAILRRAILSWQTFITLVITLVLFFGVPITNIPFWQQWFWLVLGALAEGAFIISNLTDPEATQQAIASEFESKYDLRGIKSAVSRQRLQSALEYRRNMLLLVKRHKGAMRLSLQQTVDDINDWIGHMYDLALHIDAFDNNELVERDRRMVPQQLDKARIRLERERDPEVRRELELQIQQLEQQLTNLEATVNSVKRAEIQLESTLSSLGTIYAQMSLLGTKEVDSARAQRLRLEIQDEVAGLQDTIDAMAEVQNQRLTLR
ncbi:MAG: hypothetical protein DWB42_06905 [Chloroflexi bacterium]|nr:hypothetical protein [Chloroflexota bacterium]MDL1884527.1 hypothetical protein [Anaerolineae bacterium CFX8]